MKQSFIRLDEQPASLDEVYDLRELVDSALGLRISISKKGQPSIDIEFDEPIAYRSFLEEAQAKFWPHFHANKSALGSVYLVANSDWLESFDRADFIHYKDPKHYLIVTSQTRIDVISCHEPTFSVIQ